MLVERCNGHSWIHCCWQKGVKRRECWTVEHQPNLTLRRGDSIAHVWMDALNQETMDLYFSLLEEVLMKHNLVDKPSQICNVDESGVPLDPKPPNVITKKGGLISSFRKEGASNNCWLCKCYWTGNSTHGYFRCMQLQPCMHGQKENFLEPNMA